jgi:hypothetical protein
MADIDTAVIAQRLLHLRKHLGERQGNRLTIQDVAQLAEIPEYKMIRLEHGKGTAESLLTLLHFYRRQGYNLDWMITPDNTHVPMLLPAGPELLQLSQFMQRFSYQLQQDYDELTAYLRGMGYSPLDKKPFTTDESDTSLPEGFDFPS